MILTLPYPPRALNPNTRRHWAEKARSAKRYRHDCCILAKPMQLKIAEGDIHMFVIFYPPDKRPRDRDNMVASVKALFDGLADAWGVDDRRFVQTYDVGAVTKGGMVTVEVMQ